MAAGDMFLDTDGTRQVVEWAKEQLAEKANIDGYYEEMTVGDAEQLVSSVYVNDSVPYKFRTTGGTADVGNREYAEEIVGGTVAWNQLVQTSDTSVTVPNGHKYVSYISGAWGVGTSAGTAITVDGASDKIFDITQMFGTSVANSVSSASWFTNLFPTASSASYNSGELISVEGLSSHDTVGFNQWDEEWANGYFNADTGEFVESATNSALASKNYIPVINGLTYCIKQPTNLNPQVYQYDANYGFISRLTNIGTVNGTFTVASNCRYIKFICFNYGAGKYNNDICINLSWDGERNGEYEPYQQHSYPLDSSLTLRGIPKLSDGKLYYDGDIYASDGTVTRRYGIVDLGTLTWTKGATTSGHYRFWASLSGAKISPSDTYIANIICTKYNTVTPAVTWNAARTGIAINNGTLTQVLVNDPDYYDSTASAFKTAMSGVYLVYELATPTTESATPYQQIQICDDFGTEAFVSETIVPVGHETKYPANLKAKVEMAPNSPSGDGDYIVRQTGGLNTYVPVASNATISGLAAKLPNPPSENGTYTLKVTVADGNATYSWES